MSLRTSIQPVFGAMVECDVEDICALVELCKFSSQTKVWPARIHICPLGQTELAHPNVHPNFDSRVAVNALAERLYEPHRGDRFFVLGLTNLIRENSVHHIFRHTMMDYSVFCVVLIPWRTCTIIVLWRLFLCWCG